MIKQNKKASRDTNLIVLSHEHHHGLIFCSRLKKTVNVDSDTVRRYILDFWGRYLFDHFLNEELVFLPYLKEEELTTQFKNEHQIVRDLMDEIKNPIGPIHQQALQFSKLIHDHIRFEERTFFPWLEQKLTQNQLAKVGYVFQEMEVTAHDFLPKFWEI